MKKVTLIIMLLLAGVCSWAQQIVDVHQQGDKIVIEYDIDKPADFIRVYVSTDGGSNYRGPLVEVSGDVKNVEAGYNRSITWDVLKEFKTFESENVKFKLTVKMKEKFYQETFVTVNGAYSSASQMSFGFSVGQVRHFGWFASFMTNGSFTGMGNVSKCDDTGFVDGGYFPMYTGTVSTSRLSVIAGGMVRIVGPLCARVGVGYGVRNLCWQTMDHEWCLNKDHSVQGVDMSAGLQAQFGGFVISLEAVTTNFQTIEGKLGVGLAFRKK